jgi:hypothetical protein
MTTTMGDVKGKFLPPLPLEVVEAEPGKKTLTFKLLSTPSDANSAKISKTVRIIDGSEDLRTIIGWKLEASEVCEGLNLTTGPDIHRILDKLMSGSASTTYRSNMAQLQSAEWGLQKKAARAAALQANPQATADELQAVEDAVQPPPYTNQMIVYSVNQVVDYFAPHKVVEKQKQFMRRQCRKPKDMKTRVFVNNLVRINNQEMIHLPPKFDSSQCLSEAELVEIVVYAIPKKWKKEMDRMSFDHTEKTMNQVIKFCEIQEGQEEGDEASDKKVAPQKGKTNGNGHPKKQKTEGSGKKDNDCLYHGRNTHPSSKCKVLKAMADSAKNSRSTNTTTKNSNNKNNKFKNQTWNRKAEDAKAAAKKELNAFVKKAVEKQLKASLKKRPKKDDDANSLNAIDICHLESDDETGLDKLTIASDNESEASA